MEEFDDATGASSTKFEEVEIVGNAVVDKVGEHRAWRREIDARMEVMLCRTPSKTNGNGIGKRGQSMSKAMIAIRDLEKYQKKTPFSGGWGIGAPGVQLQ